MGRTVNDLLRRFFPDIINLDFTAALESKLDTIEEGQLAWKEVVREFYDKFSRDVAVAEREMASVQVREEVSTEICQYCGRNMVVKAAVWQVPACPGYQCKNAAAVAKIGVRCPRCGGEIVKLRSRKGRWFFGCENYPDCEFRSWKQPVAEKCPQCQSLLVIGPANTLVCSNAQCQYKKKEDKNDGD